MPDLETSTTLFQKRRLRKIIVRGHRVRQIPGSTLIDHFTFINSLGVVYLELKLMSKILQRWFQALHIVHRKHTLMLTFW
jgi:hypothetical protein